MTSPKRQRPKWYRAAKRITARDWEQVSNAWNEIAPTGDLGHPESSLGESLSVLIGSPQIGTIWELNEHEDEIRVLLLREGMFLVHKAAYVLGASLSHADVGMVSWAPSSGYHSAFFGMRGLLGLAGISVIDWGGNHYLMDVWTQGKRNAPLSFEHLPKTPDMHRNLWVLFQRVMRVLRVPETIWPMPICAFLTELSESDFARQRNALHYELHSWPLDDLHQVVVLPRFGVCNFRDNHMETTGVDFSVVLGEVVLRCALGMVENLAERIPAVRNEVSRIDRWLSEQHGSRYKRCVWGEAS